MTRFGTYLGCSALVVVIGCGPKAASTTELGGTDTGGNQDPSVELTTTDSEPQSGSTDTSPVDPSQAVDILFVIDNSATMGEEQLALVTGVNGLLAPFELAGMDVRVAVTTTDNGSQWCLGDGVNAPEAGRFVASSCRSRLNEFEAPFGAGAEYACTDVCDVEQLDLPNAWLEGESLNIDNLRCALPQGINGCGFESQLEVLWKSLLRTEDPQQPEFGFVRDGAHLMVIIVSDEADCSFNPVHEDTVFGPDGNKVFWSLPDTQFAPTSAVCWNAGVECSGDPSAYTSCIPQDKDVNGVPAATPSDAALLPLDKYTDALAALRAQKQATGGEVFVFGILGVPTDYPQTGILQYSGVDNAPDADSSVTLNGIDPGCSSESGTGVPPVRMRQLIEEAEVTQQGAIHSICATDFEPSLAAMAQRVATYGR